MVAQRGGSESQPRKSGGPEGSGPKRGGQRSGGSERWRPKPGKSCGGAEGWGGPMGGGPKGGGPEGGEAQHFAFFSLSHSHFCSFILSLGVFFSLSGVFSLNFGGV